MTACQRIQNISKEIEVSKKKKKKSQMEILELKIITERKRGISGEAQW